MDQAISSVIGAIIFAAFVGGLANSIGAVPFFVIVGLVIAVTFLETSEVVREALRGVMRRKSGQGEG